MGLTDQPWVVPVIVGAAVLVIIWGLVHYNNQTPVTKVALHVTSAPTVVVLMVTNKPVVAASTIVSMLQTAARPGNVHFFVRHNVSPSLPYGQNVGTLVNTSVSSSLKLALQLTHFQAAKLFDAATDPTLGLVMLAHEAAAKYPGDTVCLTVGDATKLDQDWDAVALDLVRIAPRTVSSFGPFPAVERFSSAGLPVLKRVPFSTTAMRSQTELACPVLFWSRTLSVGTLDMLLGVSDDWPLAQHGHDVLVTANILNSGRSVMCPLGPRFAKWSGRESTAHWSDVFMDPVLENTDLTKMMSDMEEAMSDHMRNHESFARLEDFWGIDFETGEIAGRAMMGMVPMTSVSSHETEAVLKYGSKTRYLEVRRSVSNVVVVQQSDGDSEPRWPMPLATVLAPTTIGDTQH